MRLYYIPGEEKEAADLFKEFPQTLDFWENVIGPYPWADQKMGVVRVPFSGLENQTLIGHSGPYTKTPLGWNWLLNHEFAHEWFANQLSNANYDDLWLHEGLGSYAPSSLSRGGSVRRRKCTPILVVRAATSTSRAAGSRIRCGN
jgi:aminopeptidase N